MNDRITQYLNHFKAVHNGEPWYGDDITSKLDGVTDDTAFIRPVEGVHSIAEVVAHMTYWRMSLISRLKRDASFKASVESDDNWRDPSVLRVEGWTRIREAFETSQQIIIELLSRQPAEILDTEYEKGRTFDYLVEGIIDHDVYHLGQIGLIRKMVTG